MKLARFDGGEHASDEAFAAAGTGELGHFTAQDDSLRNPLSKNVGERRGQTFHETPERGLKAGQILAATSRSFAPRLGGANFQIMPDALLQAANQGAMSGGLESQSPNPTRIPDDALEVARQVYLAPPLVLDIDKTMIVGRGCLGRDCRLVSGAAIMPKNKLSDDCVVALNSVVYGRRKGQWVLRVNPIRLNERPQATTSRTSADAR